MEIKFCNNCLAMSTRPRISFDNEGRCNACVWSIKKKKYNWSNNILKLNKYIKKIKKNNDYDCIVPVSGGKDGSYVYHNVKKKFNLKPLAVTVSPPLPQEIGEKNLKNFVDKNVPLITVNPPSEVMRKMNLLGFDHLGFPYYGWLVAIHTAVLRIATNFNIKLIFYGEDGELEYGGTSETFKNIFYDVDYQKKIYLENGLDFILKKLKSTKSDLSFFSYPDKKNYKDILLTHYSYYENWDPYQNYLLAKNNYGLIENEKSNSGTFSNFAQNDQKLYALHTYMMYLKFGFGRANQDASIEVRRGAMKRTQAVELVKLYDSAYPHEYISDYLDYYKITSKKFNSIIDKWTNKKLFKKVKNRWLPKFQVR